MTRVQDEVENATHLSRSSGDTEDEVQLGEYMLMIDGIRAGTIAVVGG